MDSLPPQRNFHALDVFNILFSLRAVIMVGEMPTYFEKGSTLLFKLVVVANLVIYILHYRFFQRLFWLNLSKKNETLPQHLYLLIFLLISHFTLSFFLLYILDSNKRDPLLNEPAVESWLVCYFIFSFITCVFSFSSLINTAFKSRSKFETHTYQEVQLEQSSPQSDFDRIQQHRSQIRNALFIVQQALYHQKPALHKACQVCHHKFKSKEYVQVNATCLCVLHQDCQQDSPTCQSCTALINNSVESEHSGFRVYLL